MRISFTLALLTLFTSSTFGAVCEVNSDNCRAVINASACFNKYMTGGNVNNILSCLTGTEGTATNKQKMCACTACVAPVMTAFLTKNKKDQWNLIQRSLHGDNDIIQWLETVMCASNTLDQGFTNNPIDNYITSVPAVVPNGGRWVCIEGGSEVIIKAMQAQLKVTPQLQKRAKEISINSDADFSNLGMPVQVAGENAPRQYTTLHSTTTLACAQGMDLSGAGLFLRTKESYPRPQVLHIMQDRPAIQDKLVAER
ncbi:hypothetical protein BKA65DRAFT_535397 [Rhexocercosporidium sp. MPI-PUGE-AT-0058]|nr:hypothetical protein BKA65DRAFT_535397 [Rhexocercosporidium sp. MPI-PUGE-AT-0058]